MKTLKWFSLEWAEQSSIYWGYLLTKTKDNFIMNISDNEQQAFQWLEANGYIERTGDDNKMPL